MHTQQCVVFLAFLSITTGGKLQDFDHVHNKIIGGETAEKNAYPFQISLQKKYDDGYFHMCGGSLIDESTFVCAAHCIKQKPLNNLRVVAGVHNLKVDEDKTWQISKIAKAKYHEEFDIDGMHKNDISIIKLQNPFKFNSYVNSIELPPNGSEPKAGTNCKNSGWGATEDLGSGFPNVLQVVTLPIIDREICKLNYTLVNPIFESQICAGYMAHGACFGDSGGPLFCSKVESENKTTPYLAGIVSWGSKPCAHFPGVYTNVGSFTEWIEQNRH